MKRLLSLLVVSALLCGLSAEAMAKPGFHGSKPHSGSPKSPLLVAQLVPATGGMATTVGAAPLLINKRGQVILKIRGLAGAGGPITDTGSLEIDIVVNGSPVSPSPAFAVPVVNGNADVNGTLPVVSGDLVEILAFRVLDSTATELLRAGGTIGSVKAARFEVHGTISNLAGTCPGTTFEVNGVVVTTDANTQYEDGNCSALADGVKVEAKGTILPDGTHLATKVEFDDEEHDDDEDD
jgi:hypothetical protein